MRYLWLAPAIVVLDLLSRLALFDGAWPDAIKNINLNASAYNISGIILLCAVLLVLLPLMRKAAAYISLFPLTMTGLQFMLGGITSLLIERVFYAPVFSLPDLVVSIPVPLDIPTIVILIGLGLLLYDMLQRHRAPDLSALPLKPSSIKPVDLSEAIIGIDNVHSDVFLSPRFQTALHTVIHSFLTRTINKNRANAFKSSTPYSHHLKVLRDEYFDVVSTAIKRYTHHKDELQLRLLYIAIIKLIHDEISTSFEHFNHKLKHHPSHNKITYTKEGAQSPSFLLSSSSNTHFLVAKEIYKQLEFVETNLLRKFQQALTGNEFRIMSNIFRVPLLYASSALDNYVLCHHYLLLNNSNSAANSFFSLEEFINKTLGHNLRSIPEYDNYIATDMDEHSAENLGYQKVLAQPSVLMNAKNVTLLLDIAWSERKLAEADAENDRELCKTYKQQIRFQRNQITKLLTALNRAGMTEDLLTAYAISNEFKSGERTYDPGFVQKLLVILFRDVGKKVSLFNFIRRKKRLVKIGVSAETQKAINTQLENNPVTFLLKFIRDFANYRRDLQKILYIQQAVNNIHLVQSTRDIQTSRSNGSLYQFLTAKEYDAEKKSAVVRHTILKADLRGSTRITEELTKKDLNAATHFSRNFFSPINEKLEQYKARKVFIEGDALILIFTEDDDTSTEKLCVSYACGLASDIIRIVERQNMMLEKYKLPVLELGIGIAFNNTPPRYLFDEDSKITISPAINRADRLSSCAWALKQWMHGSIEDSTHVKMFEPSEQARSTAVKAEKELIYNLNGILLEETAFMKLFKETSFRQLKVELPSLKGSRILFGQFPDATGSMKSIIVRAAPVQVYDPSYQHDTAPIVNDRYYYEVIHDKKLLNDIKNNMTSS